jgi:hypothetical protein
LVDFAIAFFGLLSLFFTEFFFWEEFTAQFNFVLFLAWERMQVIVPRKPLKLQAT